MTTIAIDKTTIAADGLRTWGDQIAGRAHKKIKVVPGKAIYAFTGLAPMFDVMVEWHQKGADPEDVPQLGKDSDNGWTLIVIDKEGVGKFTSSCPYFERFDAPVAWGAGQDYAMGAMAVGAGARRAVEAVASFTTHTGGEIQVVDIAEALGLKRLEAAE